MAEAKGKLIFDKHFFEGNEELLDKYFYGLTKARKNKKYSENTIKVTPTSQQNGSVYLFEANTYDNTIENLPELMIPLCLIAEKISAKNFDEVENFVKVFQRLIDSKTGIKVEWVEEETMLYCDDTFTTGTATIIPNAGKIDLDEKLRYDYQGALSDWRLSDNFDGIYQKENCVRISSPDSPLNDTSK